MIVKVIQMLISRIFIECIKFFKLFQLSILWNVSDKSWNISLKQQPKNEIQTRQKLKLTLLKKIDKLKEKSN